MNLMKKQIAFISIIILVCFILVGCQQPGKSSDSSSSTTSSTPSKTYAIGDTGPSGAGIVFYITNGGLNGLEAAASDISTTSEYSNVASTQIGTSAEGTAIGTGSANTDAVIAQPLHTASAAKLCRNYTGGGKADWFLPSIDELVQLYAEKTVVGNFSVGHVCY